MLDRCRVDGGAAVVRPRTQDPAGGGSVVTTPEVIFEGVSKFYGEVLGVNGVTLRIPAGITSLVGPNGSGKTTLMNLMAGLIFPDGGSITMRGLSRAIRSASCASPATPPSMTPRHAESRASISSPP